MIVNTAARAAQSPVDLIAAINQSDVVKGAFEAFTPSIATVVTCSGWEIQVALGHNVEGWEAVVDHNGEQTGLPDGPGADATVFEVATWVDRVVRNYDDAGRVRAAFEEAHTALCKAYAAWTDVQSRSTDDDTFLLDPDYPFQRSLDEVVAEVGTYVERLAERLGQ